MATLKRKRHTSEQAVPKFREGERMFGFGQQSVSL